MDGQEKKRRTIIVKAYTLHELAKFVYDYSKYHMRKLIKRHEKKIGKREGYFYEKEQVEKIFKLIPLPSDIDLI